MYSNVILRGVPFRGEAAVNYALALQPGELLDLRRDPNNEHDANAVAVWTRGEYPMHLAFVGREFAAYIGPELDDNPDQPLVAEVEEVRVTKGGTPYPVVTVRAQG